jgi:YVTN family beta-propeller protein
MRSVVVVCLLALALFTGVASAARSQVTTVAVGVGPAAIAVDSARNRLFVTSARSNTLSVLDGSTRAVLATITRPPGGQPVALAVDPAAGRLYDLDAALNQVLVWDEATHALLARWPVPAKPRGIGVDPVLRRVYVTSAAGGVGTFTALNESTGARITSRQVGTDPRGIAVDASTGEAYVADAGTQVVYVLNAQIALEVNFYPIPDGAVAVAVDTQPGATRVWVAGGRGVTVLFPDRNVVAGTVRIGGVPSAIAVNTATGRGYAVSAGATVTAKGTLTVLDPPPPLSRSAATIVEKVPVGASPLGVAVDLYNSRVFVASAGGDNDPGSVAVASAFEPVTDGFHFPNHFTGRTGGGFDLVATPFGLSGGMVYAALDTFNLGWQAPPDTTPPALGSVREYLSKREVEGLGTASSALVKRFHLWQSYPATGAAGLPQRSLGEFERALRPKLDKGVPVPVGVVRAARGRPVWENREVLATGYFRRGNQWVLELYDPAAPDRTVYLFTATRRETLRPDGTGLIGSPWRGFFAIATYKRATPPWAPPAA